MYTFFLKIIGIYIVTFFYITNISAMSPPNWIEQPKGLEVWVQSGNIIVSKIFQNKKEVVGMHKNIDFTHVYLTGSHIIYRIFSGSQIALVLDGKIGDFYDNISDPIFDTSNEHFAYMGFKNDKIFVLLDNILLKWDFDGIRRIETLAGTGIITELVSGHDPTKEWRNHIFLNNREIWADFDNTEWVGLHYILSSTWWFTPEMLYIAKKWKKNALIRETFDGKRNIESWYDEIHNFDVHIDPLQYCNYVYSARIGKKYYFVENGKQGPAYDWLSLSYWEWTLFQFYRVKWKEYIIVLGRKYWPYDKIETPIHWITGSVFSVVVNKNWRKYFLYQGKEYFLWKL